MFYIEGLVYIGNLYSNGQSMGYVLFTRLTIQLPDGVHLSGIQMVGLSGIQMALKNQTIWHPTSFRPSEYLTS